MQEGLTQEVEGTQVSELPVSKQPVNCFGGVPSWKTPKYCTGHTSECHVCLLKFPWHPVQLIFVQVYALAVLLRPKSGTMTVVFGDICLLANWLRF